MQLGKQVPKVVHSARAICSVLAVQRFPSLGRVMDDVWLSVMAYHLML